SNRTTSLRGLWDIDSSFVFGDFWFSASTANCGILEENLKALFSVSPCLCGEPISGLLVLGRDREPAPHAESLLRNLQPGRRLLALVLRPVHHAHHPPNQPGIEAALLGDLLRRLQVLDVVFQYPVQDLVGRQRVRVLLIGPQLRRGRLLNRGPRNSRGLRIYV